MYPLIISEKLRLNSFIKVNINTTIPLIKKTINNAKCIMQCQ